MAQTTTYLQTPELKKAFYHQYVTRVKQEALGLVGEEHNATKLTQAVFEEAYTHFESHTVPANSEMYLLAKTNLLYAQNVDVYTTVETMSVETVTQSVPEERVEPVSTVRITRSRKREMQRIEKVEEEAKPTMHSSMVPATFATNEEMMVAPNASEISRKTTQPASPLVRQIPMQIPIPVVQVKPIAPQMPVQEPTPLVFEPIVTAPPLTSAQESKEDSKPLVYNQAQTMHWTPEMDVSTESIAATKSEEVDESMRRSIPLTILNTLLFILTVIAFGFLLYELDVFSMFL